MNRVQKAEALVPSRWRGPSSAHGALWTLPESRQTPDSKLALRVHVLKHAAFAKLFTLPIIGMTLKHLKSTQVLDLSQKPAFRILSIHCHYWALAWSRALLEVSWCVVSKSKGRVP